MFLPAKVLSIYIKDLLSACGRLENILMFRELGAQLRGSLIELIKDKMDNYDALDICFDDIGACEVTFLDELLVETVRCYWPYKNKVFCISSIDIQSMNDLDLWLYGVAWKRLDRKSRVNIVWRGKGLEFYNVVGPIENKMRKAFEYIASRGSAIPRDMINIGEATDIAGASTLLRKVYAEGILLRKKDYSEGYLQHIYYLPALESERRYKPIR